MSQLLHAGIIAGRRQLAALVALTLILLVITPQDHIAQNSSAADKAEILSLSAMRLFTWAALLVALGLALTSNRSIDITASRIQRGSRIVRLGSPQHILMSLVAQFGLAAILFAIFALQAPPNAIVSISDYFGFSSAASIIWTAVMSVGVASFGASAHAAVKAIEHHNAKH
jgi:hypothetical protein